jgi:diaminohydroxyphosphoribosylaminopyrimidine deaminase / 5-amino-6-(5-phosphoribosylamino)uracil reductase
VSGGGAPGSGVSGGGAPGGGPAANAADRRWLRQAIELSRRCPPSPSAFSVGAVIVAADGSTLTSGFSRERDPYDHAEEGALATLDPGDRRLPGATLYSSLEPCRFRASRPRPCAELIIAAGVHRVVIAWLEPPVFAQGGGAELLRSSGVTVVEVAELADQARTVNAAVLGG